MKISEKQIGLRLKTRREAMHLSQARVAERMEVATSTVARLERGELNATLSTIMAACDALELPLATALDLKQPTVVTPRELLFSLRDALNDQSVLEHFAAVLEAARRTS